MSDTELIRINKVLKELNVGLDNAVDYLSSKGIVIDKNPNVKITAEAYQILLGQFSSDKKLKEESDKFLAAKTSKKESSQKGGDEAEPATESIQNEVAPEITEAKAVVEPEALVEPVKEIEKEIVPEVAAEKVVIKATKKAASAEESEEGSDDLIRATSSEEKSVTVVGKIDLSSLNSKTKPDKKSKSAKKEVEAEKPTKPIVEEEKPKTKGKKKVEEELVVPTPEASEEVAAPIAEVEQATETPSVVAEGDKSLDDASKEKLYTADNTQTLTQDNVHVTTYTKIEGPKVMGSIQLPVAPEKKKSNQQQNNANDARQKRKRIKKNVNINDPNLQRPGGQNQGGNRDNNRPNTGGGNSYNKPHGDRNRNDNRAPKAELTPEEIQQQIKETLARLSNAGKSKASKHRRQKRDEISRQMQDEMNLNELEKRNLKVTEFVSASELAKMMNVQVNDVISTCMSLGMFVSINQRLNAETINIVAEEFGYSVEFVSAESTVDVVEEIDSPESLVQRSPIVTVMGHVDHGKTSLLDYIRKANVIAGEAGGITQHIGAYNVKLENGKSITFLDTPGHEAFTAMRARGAQVTDIVIVVVAADDNVMPQTKEAINHAQAAGVPIVFAINKIDKPSANPDKIREELSAINILVEEWGGKYQCQEISAKKGTGVHELLEKVLLEAEILDVKANPNKKAIGTVIESSLDKGRGYISTILVQAGTMKVGDIVLAGCFSGRVKALTNERNMPIKNAGPSIPALLLGLSGAPQAGDTFKVMDDEREAREIATRRLQLQREQGIRTHKHITLDEIGRRLAIGDFKELNIIVKGDVDGSIEALTDSLLKLSTDKIQVNVIHKSVGQVTESDVLLASASNAIIVAFQVRPSANARKLAEQEQIDIRLYSIIYDAINEVKAAMEGMLAPEFEEKIVCNVQIRQVFKISKVGTIAGCMVMDGKITRNTKVRVIRDGIVVHTGALGSLKRFKDDVKEVATGYECGLDIANFNDIQEGDLIEGYEMVEIKKKLA
jgi:translation initiation factor IF-2